ncbi:hypothetical protein [Paenibacillus sp. V4I5]|nr:hypothetical protein [Paenibacillus sp. V4I5]
MAAARPYCQNSQPAAAYEGTCPAANAMPLTMIDKVRDRISRLFL